MFTLCILQQRQSIVGICTATGVLGRTSSAVLLPITSTTREQNAIPTLGLRFSHCLDKLPAPVCACPAQLSISGVGRPAKLPIPVSTWATNLPVPVSERPPKLTGRPSACPARKRVSKISRPADLSWPHKGETPSRNHCPIKSTSCGNRTSMKR
jgi:hypothetical protein